MNDPGTAVARIFRDEYPRIIGALTRRFGDLDLAEDMAAEALVRALEVWPEQGVPANPGGWLTTTATRRALDRLRREQQRQRKYEAAYRIADDSPPEEVGAVPDDRLRLLFVCAHPALARPARVALTLRLIGGLEVAEIARSFLVPETTMAQRITRAKAKIKGANIGFKVPAESDLPQRLDGVLEVLYLIFNEGYLAGSGDEPLRADLSQEAIRLTRLVCDLLPTSGEARGLLALELLAWARRDARLEAGADGGPVALVPLDRQDRTRWDAAAIEEGHALVRTLLAENRPGRYQLLAAINAVHTDAATWEATDWRQIEALYAQLSRIDPNPIVTLNRAIAVAELDGAHRALRLVEELDLARYQPWHATRADLLARLGRHDEAAAAYRSAIELSDNPAEIAFLEQRLAAL